MTSTMTIDEHLEALSAASARLDIEVRAAGEHAPVPTCPAWDARALLAHIVMVHHWAGSHVLGEDDRDAPSQTELRAGDADLFPLFASGVARLTDALRAVSDGLEAMVFLRDAPAPRAFWARRQAHETTIHAVDALAARLGRPPTSAEAGIPARLARDGIDELLLGFVPRGRSHWTSTEPFTLAVRPSDSDRRWSLNIGAERVTASATDAPHADAVFAGTAAQLYLGLWNRGDEITGSGSVAALETWRTVQRVSWS